MVPHASIQVGIRKMVRPIERISPSTAYSFYLCQLKEILRFNNMPPLLPSFPSARLGTAIHSVLEEAAKGRINDKPSFEEQWRIKVSLVEGIMGRIPAERHLIPLEESARTFEVKKIQAWNLIKKSYISHDPFNKPSSLNVEKGLESSSSKVGGRTDLIVTRNEGAEIVDFKTGNLLDESGKPKVEYQMQMKLYAALYYDNYSEWPRKLTLVGLNQERHEIGFSPNECRKLLSDLEHKLDDVNKKIQSDEPLSNFASPSPEACRYCPYRPTCLSYWSEREDSEAWPKDVSGKVIEKSASRMGLLRIILENKGKRYIIRGLSARNSLNDDRAQNVLVCNLGQDQFSGQFMETQMTIVFQEEMNISNQS